MVRRRHNVSSAAFHCPPLSEKDRQDLLLEAKLACKFLVVDATASDALPIDNVVVNSKTGRHATARRIRDQVDSSLIGTSAHTRVRATLEDIVSFFRLDSPSKVHDYARVMGDTFTDNVSLYTLMEPGASIAGDRMAAWPQDGGQGTSSMHYVGVEWQVSKLKGFSPRDFCFLDYQDSFFFVDQATGQERRGWARCLHSVDLDCCPDMEKSAGLIRAKMVRSGHVFIESTDKEGVLDYYKNYFIIPGGNVLKHFPTLYMKKMLKQYTTTVLNLEEHLIQQRLRPILDVPVSSFQSKKDVSSCMHCFHRFNWIVAKKQCRSCGDITCFRCCSPWRFHLDRSSYVKVDLCQQCVLDEAELPVAFAARTSRTTSRSSRVPSGHNRSHHRPHFADDARASDGHNYRVRPSQFSHFVHPPAMIARGGDAYNGQPCVITLGRTSPPDNNHRPPREAAPQDNNSPDSVDHDEIRVISPTEWRGSQLTSTSSVRDVLLTFHSDSSSIYL